MSKSKNKVRIGIICISLIIFLICSPALGFPPDNAAVLYLRAFIIYEEPENEELNNMIIDLQDGKIKPNDQIRQYFEKNRPVIELVTTASQIPDCDWGRDHSKGFDLMMPELATVRKLAFMFIADSKVFLNDGDYKTSLERCLTIHRMARHIGDDLIISNLVAVAMNGLANKHIKIILSQMPGDIETLQWLKNQMLDISAKTPSLISAIFGESEITTREMRKESRKYYMDFIALVQAAFGLPYENAYRELEKLNEKVTKEAGTRPEALATSIMSPSVTKLYTNEVTFKTSFNAVNAAINLYLAKAKTGRLPDELPDGMPKDLFSGKDFIYEKTGDGFILRCQGKDLNKDKIHEYEFKVKK